MGSVAGRQAMTAVDLFKRRYANTVEQLCVEQERAAVLTIKLDEALARIAELEKPKKKPKGGR